MEGPVPIITNISRTFNMQQVLLWLLFETKINTTFCNRIKTIFRPIWYAEFLTIQYGVLVMTADYVQSIEVNETTCNQYNASAMYIYDIAILTVSYFCEYTYNNHLIKLIIFQLREPIPSEYMIPVVLEDRENTTVDTLNATVIGWGRNFVRLS